MIPPHMHPMHAVLTCSPTYPVPQSNPPSSTAYPCSMHGAALSQGFSLPRGNEVELEK
jgi:hypothetical protein